MAVYFAATNPERVRALILFGTASLRRTRP